MGGKKINAQLFHNPSPEQFSKHIEIVGFQLRPWGKDIKDLAKDVARLRKARMEL